MAITAAEVEANGWVLRLTVSGGLVVPNSNFAAYVLDPDGAPRVALATSHAGFVKSAGMAVAGTMLRSLVATRPLRLPVNPASPTVKVLDETDLGGGLVRVRLWLSETVHATDTGLTLAVLAGWRPGAAAEGGIAVVNNSARVAPIPILRWVLPSYEVAAAPFRLALIVASHHPVGFEPVAGVKFTVTDGVTVKTVWTTALATDTSLGDNLRCYTAMIDPATATALTAGLLRCDAEVYPWLGSMRSTDPAGTRSMATLRTDGYSSAAAAPFVVGYDPAGTRYSQMWAFVDPVNGTATPATAMIAASLAAAKAIAPASRPRDVTTAVAAAANLSRVLPAANGQAATAARANDGLRIVLAAGTHLGFGATAISSTANTTEMPVYLVGDPDNADPRNNCVVETIATAGVNLRTSRLRVRNLTVLTGGVSLATMTYVLADNVEFRGRAGSEAVATAPLTTGATPVGQVAWTITRSRFWKTGWTPTGANRQVGLFRANQNARPVSGVTIVKNRWIPPAEDGFTSDAATPQGYGMWAVAGDLGSHEDVFLAYNDIRRIRHAAWRPLTAPATLAGTSLNSQRRHVLLNNVVERGSTGANTSDTQFGYGEGALVEMSYIIIEGNTFAGDGYNAFYNDPSPTTTAERETFNSLAYCIRNANNATARNASKQDDFNSPDTTGFPGTGGYRPVLTGCWGTHWGVDMEAHVDLAQAGTIANFRREFPGLRGAQFEVATAGGWTADRSESGDNAGGGDYAPLAGSVLLGRVRRGNSDRDFAGNTRQVNGASGAFELVAGAPLQPAGSRISQLAGSVGVGLLLQVMPAGAGSAVSGSVTMVGWGAGLVPANDVLGQMAAQSGLSMGTATGGGQLAPFGTRHVLVTADTLVLPDGGADGLPALRVMAEPRVLSVR